MTASVSFMRTSECPADNSSSEHKSRSNLSGFHVPIHTDLQLPVIREYTHNSEDDPYNTFLRCCRVQP